MSPALNGITALQCFERGNAVKIHNGISTQTHSSGKIHTTMQFIKIQGQGMS